MCVCTALWQKQNYFHFFLAGSSKANRTTRSPRSPPPPIAPEPRFCAATGVIRRPRSERLEEGTGDVFDIFVGSACRRGESGEFGRVERFGKYPVEIELKPGRKRTEKKIGKKLWGRFSLGPCEIRYCNNGHARPLNLSVKYTVCLPKTIRAALNPCAIIRFHPIVLVLQWPGPPTLLELLLLLLASGQYDLCPRFQRPAEKQTNNNNRKLWYQCLS